MSSVINKNPRVYTLTQKSQRVFTVYKILTFGLIDDIMRYLKSIDLPSGVETAVTTILTAAQKPYSKRIMIPLVGGEYDDISSQVTFRESNPATTGGVYVFYIYNGGAALTNVELRILY